MNELERLWSNVLSERSCVLRAQKALVDAQKKYSHAVDLFQKATLAEENYHPLPGEVFGANGETGI